MEQATRLDDLSKLFPAGFSIFLWFVWLVKFFISIWISHLGCLRGLVILLFCVSSKSWLIGEVQKASYNFVINTSFLLLWPTTVCSKPSSHSLILSYWNFLTRSNFQDTFFLSYSYCLMLFSGHMNQFNSGRCKKLQGEKEGDLTGNALGLGVSHVKLCIRPSTSY